MGYNSKMSIFRKLGGLACVCVISGAGVTLPSTDAAACGFMMPPVSYVTGSQSALPAYSLGVFVEIQYQSAKASSEDFKVVRTDAKGHKTTIAITLEAADSDYRRFIAFDRPAQPGETYSVRYQNGSTNTLSVSEQVLKPADGIKLSVKVDTKGNATLTARASDSVFSGMWQYNMHFQGEKFTTARSTQSYLNLCKDSDTATGWQELAVEIVPNNELSLATMATLDVWVDCGLAQIAKHPSISKSSSDYFVPDTSVSSL